VLDVLPVAGKSGPESWVLPVVALAAGPAASLALIVRVEMLRVLGHDYMRTARAKRLPARLL
jgi:peptide/nickel transport system permease protein